MNQKTLGLLLLGLLWVLPLAAQDHSADSARRIDDFFLRIARRTQKTVFLKKMRFSEAEFNSYLNLIYVKRYAPEVTRIHLGMRDKNEIVGEMAATLKGKKYAAVPAPFRDIRVRFSGRVECSAYRMRFQFAELEINGNRISPELVDEAFGLAQVRFRVKKSLFDWFNLLPGLKKVETTSGQIALFY